MLFDRSTAFSLFLVFLAGASTVTGAPRSLKTRGNVHHRRQNSQGDGAQGDTDGSQGDLSGRPPAKFAYPVATFPTANETVVFTEAYYVQPGEVFDGKMKRYERVEGSCNEQAEGTDADTVFNLLPGSTIRNVIIGKHQSEGIHALGDAWVENVWWEDVCEDALTSKGLNTQLRVIGGGARNAQDKIFQDNSLGGKFNITGFYAENFGTFYQSCGNCLNQAKRNATIQNVIAVNGNRMGIINPNHGDEFRIKDSQIQNVTFICDKEIGNNVQTVPYWIGTGPDQKYCLYNSTRDHLTGFNGTANTVYFPPKDTGDDEDDKEEEDGGEDGDDDDKKGKDKGKHHKRWYW